MVWVNSFSPSYVFHMLHAAHIELTIMQILTLKLIFSDKQKPYSYVWSVETDIIRLHHTKVMQISVNTHS